MAPRKPAIALGPIDDIVKAVMKEIAKKNLSRTIRTNVKSVERLEKKVAKSGKGSVPSTPRSQARTRKQAENMKKANDMYSKYKGGR
jgi:hypothetical protein